MCQMMRALLLSPPPPPTFPSLFCHSLKLLFHLLNFFPGRLHLLAFFFQPIVGLYSSACQFPLLEDWLSCQRDSPQMNTAAADSIGAQGWPPLNGWFCDPELSISMSELLALDETVRQVYGQHKGPASCVCPVGPSIPLPASRRRETQRQQQQQQPQQSPFTTPTALPAAAEEEAAPIHRHSHCWYRFGFAFLRQLNEPLGLWDDSSSSSADQCEDGANGNGSAIINTDKYNSVNGEEEGNVQPPNNGGGGFTGFAQNFAKLLRERWALGQCGEDLLLLVVQRPMPKHSAAGLAAPHDPMPPVASSRLFGPTPMLFVAPGPLVFDRLGTNLDALVQEANEQLQKEGRPLFRVLGHFLIRVGYALARAQSGTGGTVAVNGQHRLVKSRSHVPLWAWGVFAACGIAFGLMALGLFLIRTRTRRSGTSGGQQQAQGVGQMVARRHWKEGEEQPQPPTYVNLVQMLMPHPKPQPTNMPQQV